MCGSDHFRLLRPLTVLIAGISFALLALTTSLANEPISKYVRKSSAGADSVIVFVHGLREDGITTWTNKNVYWPELLTHDHTFDNSDIFVYSYRSDEKTTLSIDELTENMRAALTAYGVSNYSRIIFLSHSMGGIVTRAFLLKYRNIAEKTFFAYFFSTPTTGSQLASVAQWAFNSPQIEELKSMGAEDYLANLVRQWQAANFSFPSYCAYEKRPSYGVMSVVSMESAAALCKGPLDPIDADHSGIVKPEDQNSPPYIAFKSAYTSEIRAYMSATQAPAPPSAPVASAKDCPPGSSVDIGNTYDSNFVGSFDQTGKSCEINGTYRNNAYGKIHMMPPSPSPPSATVPKP